MVLRSVIALSCVLLVGVPPALAIKGQPKKAKVVQKKTIKKKNKKATNGDALVASRSKPTRAPQRQRRVATTESAPEAAPLAPADQFRQAAYAARRPSRVKTWIAIAAVVGVTFLGFIGFQAFKVGQAADHVRDSQSQMQELHDQFRKNPWGNMPDFPNGPPSGWPSNGPGGGGDGPPSFEDMKKQVDDMMGGGGQTPSK